MRKEDGRHYGIQHGARSRTQLQCSEQIQT